MEDIDHFASFMRSLKLNCSRSSAAQAATWRQSSAARVRLPPGALGCIPDTLENRTIHPYSDFLLHDVGTGDGIPIALVEHFGRERIEKRMRELEASHEAEAKQRQRGKTEDESSES